MRFGEGLTDKQIKLARSIERAGITTYSQAIKALQRKETARVNAWIEQLKSRR